MLKLNLLTILLCIFSCEETEKNVPPAKTTHRIVEKTPVKIAPPTAVEIDVPEGRIPLPEELRVETEARLDLNKASAEQLVKTLEQEIKE